VPPTTNQPDKGLPPTEREQALIDALKAIVTETMDYPPQRPFAFDSSLPVTMVWQAQRALDLYGARVLPVRDEVPA